MPGDERAGRPKVRCGRERAGISGRLPGLRTRFGAAAAAALLLAAAGCAAGYGYTDPAAVAFEPELEVDLEGMTRTVDGLYWEDVRAGTGETASAGDTVVIRFREYLPTGNLLRNSIDEGEPTVFEIGGGRVISAWELGLVGMREGGLRRLVTPPQLAFGDLGRGQRIPGDQVLVYDILLEEVR